MTFPENWAPKPIQLTDAEGTVYQPGQPIRPLVRDGGIGGVWRASGLCSKKDEEETFAVAQMLLTRVPIDGESYGKCRRARTSNKDMCMAGKGKNVICELQWNNPDSNADCCAGLRKGLAACGPYNPNTSEGDAQCATKMQSYCGLPSSWTPSSSSCPTYCEAVLNRGPSDPDYESCRNNIAAACLRDSIPDQHKHLCWFPGLCPNTDSRLSQCDGLMKHMCSGADVAGNEDRCVCINATHNNNSMKDGISALACMDARCSGLDNGFQPDSVRDAAKNCGTGCTFIQTCEKMDDCNNSSENISFCNTGTDTGPKPKPKSQRERRSDKGATRDAYGAVVASLVFIAFLFYIYPRKRR
jgi:hypothetical protein